MGYRANSPHDVAALATRIELLPDDAAVQPLAMFFGEGLMIAPLTLRLAVRFGAWRRGVDLTTNWAHTLAKSLTNEGTYYFIPNMCRLVGHHVRNGRDREDTDSVGGWSQREIDRVTEILDACDAAWEQAKKSVEGNARDDRSTASAKR